MIIERDKLAVMLAQLKDLQGFINIYYNKLSIEKAGVGNMDETMKKLKNELDHVSAEKLQEQKQEKEAMEDLQNQLDEANNSIRDFEQQLSGGKEKVADLEQKLKDNENIILSLKEKAEEDKDAMYNLKTERDGLKSKLKVATSAATQDADQKVQDMLATNESELEKLKKSSDSQKHKIRSLEHKLSDKEAKIKELEQVIVELQAKLSPEKLNITSTHEPSADPENRISILERENADLKAKLKDQKPSSSKTSEQLSRLERETEELRARLKEKSSKSSTSEDRRQLQKEMDALKLVNEELQTRLHSSGKSNNEDYAELEQANVILSFNFLS